RGVEIGYPPRDLAHARPGDPCCRFGALSALAAVRRAALPAGVTARDAGRAAVAGSRRRGSGAGVGEHAFPAVVVVAVDLASVDVGALDPAHHVEWVARPDAQVGVLAGLDRAEPSGDAHDPRGVDGQRA